jgi:hypothetical protein
MLERCLYALEMAWHPSFNPAAASAHIPYEEQNKPLFIALLRYACVWEIAQRIAGQGMLTSGNTECE